MTKDKKFNSEDEKPKEESDLINLIPPDILLQSSPLPFVNAVHAIILFF